MKKILLLTSIFILCAQFCYAKEPVSASHEQELGAELTPIATPNVPEEVEAGLVTTQTENTEPEIDPDSLEAINSYFADESQNVEINGHVEYNQEITQEEADAVELENAADGHGITFTQPKKVSAKSVSKKATFKPIQDDYDFASKFSTQEYSISPVSTSYSQKFGKYSVGTMYNSSLDSARVNYSTGFFAKFEGKHFALTSAFSKSTNNNYDSYSDKMFIAPELKLTKRLSLLDVMKTDVYQINKSNELVLRYTPHLKKYADDVELELGAGQSFHEDTYINSSVRFSTKFKL